MENKYYIYIHCKKGTDEVFYVGKGKKDKYWSNRYRRSTNRNRYWYNIVNKYGFDAYIIEDGLSEEEALNSERMYIAQFKAWGFKLCNMTDGGEGQSGRKLTDKQKEHLRRCNLDKKHSKETKEKLSETRKGRPKLEEWKAKMRKPKSEETKAKMSAAKKGKKRAPFNEEWLKNLSEAKLRRKENKK